MFRLAAGAVLMGLVAMAAPDAPPVTFNKDVLPILQKNCQTCHRPGEVAPMSLLTYSEARPWAKAIKAAVVSQKMPPWFADPNVGHFSNERRLSQAEIATLSSWADNGAAEGAAKDAPAPLKFVDGWHIKPDVVVEMPTEFHVPATGAVDYQYMLVKTNFKEDMWVSAAEIRAGNDKVVHHGEAWVRPPGSKWMADATPGVSYATGEMRKGPGEGIEILGKFNPGLNEQTFDFGGSAKFVPKGSDIVFEFHYTSVGTPQTSRSKVGLVLAKAPVQSRYVTGYGPTANNLVLEPGDGNAEVVSEMTAVEESKLVYVQPHMHLRGKDYEVRVVYPTGETQTVFRGKFDFNWQLGYDLAKPVLLPKGTKVQGIAHFDNSANNRFNPDPSKEVVWGLQNWEEMQNCFMGFVIDKNIDPEKLFKATGPSVMKRAPGKSGPTIAALEAQ
jgi:hypothetical protein